MITMFMNSENSKTSDSHRLLLDFLNEINLNRSIYYTYKNVKESYKNNEFKISFPTWTEEFELPDGSYSVSDIHNYFQNILKQHETVTDNLSIMVSVNKIENRITFKIKTELYLELLMPETVKLLGSTKSKIIKDKNGENVSHLEFTEVVLVHCNIVNNDYQQDSGVLYIFVPNKLFGQLLNISPKYFIFLKKFNSVSSYIEVWFTDQNSNSLEAEDKISITLVINSSAKYKQ